jgi:hypothetical protein
MLEVLKSRYAPHLGSLGNQIGGYLVRAKDLEPEFYLENLGNQIGGYLVWVSRVHRGLGLESQMCLGD